MRNMFYSLAICLLVFGAASCAWGVGTRHVHEPTVGQELMDLKSALDQGAITQDEYDRKKEEILRKR